MYPKPACTADHATAVTTINPSADNRVAKPTMSNTGKTSSAHMARFQLTVSDNQLNGKGNWLFISANQFSPFHFSRPDSRNSIRGKSLSANKPKAACQRGIGWGVHLIFLIDCVSNGMGRKIHRHHPIFYACLDAAALKNWQNKWRYFLIHCFIKIKNSKRPSETPCLIGFQTAFDDNRNPRPLQNSPKSP